MDTIFCKIPYPKGAKSIYIGVISSGEGKLWADDFELLIDGVSIANYTRKLKKAEQDLEFDKGSKTQSIPITSKKVVDLQALGLVWGFLKYYHPNIAKGDFNWDYELFRVLPKVMETKNKKERDNVLVKWIESLGHFKIGSGIILPQNNVKNTPDLDWITSSGFSEELKKNLLNVKNAERTEENFYFELDGYGIALINNEKSYATMKFPDSGFRLLSLYRYWNIIQYLYPYRNLIEEDWKEVLKEFIPKFVGASNELEYKLSALEIICRVHDTHAGISGREDVLKGYFGIKCAPIEITFVENKAVVTYLFEKEFGAKTGLQIGDVILAINKKSVETIISERLKYTPASNYPTQLRVITERLLRTNDSILSLKYIRNDKEGSMVVYTYPYEKVNVYRKYQTRDSCFRFINPEIGYIKLGSIKAKYLPKIMKDIEKTKGLVIDLRCYPSEFVVFSLTKYLMPASKDFAKFSSGNIITPGLFTFGKTLQVGENNENCYRGKVVILVNEITQSSAEYHAMAFRVVPNAIVIGSTTAGADGNVTMFSLPGGISTAITGIGTYYPDGRETQRVGIVPDIVVKPTIKGIKEKRDELIEKAIEIINTK